MKTRKGEREREREIRSEREREREEERKGIRIHVYFCAFQFFLNHALKLKIKNDEKQQ